MPKCSSAISQILNVPSSTARNGIVTVDHGDSKNFVRCSLNSVIYYWLLSDLYQLFQNQLSTSTIASYHLSAENAGFACKCFTTSSISEWNASDSRPMMLRFYPDPKIRFYSLTAKLILIKR